MFCDKSGKPIKDITVFRKRKWINLLTQCELKYRPIKNTRHTFITHMLNSSQFKIMEIAKIVGHNSPRMIMTVYAKFIKSELMQFDDNFDLFGHQLVTSNKNIAKNKTL